MSDFRVVLSEHGYPDVSIERQIVTAAGGEFIDADAVAAAARPAAYAQADAILVRWLRVTPELIAQWPRCKIIIRYGVGYDNIDVPAATEAGIMVGHVPEYCYEEVAAHAIALLLDCIRNITAIHRKIAGGGWSDNPGRISRRMRGRTFGIVGLGSIGQAVAQRLAGWEMKLLAADPFADPARAQALGVEIVDLGRLCRESDYISLHVPLLPETRHLLGPRQFELMKPGVVLVNTARGPVIDTAALLAALDAGTVSAAGLDVFEQEPLSLDSPLRAHPRLIVTDHIAWYSEESQLELRVTAAEEAVRVCRAELPRALANPEVLKRFGQFDKWTPNTAARWQLQRLKAKG